MISRASVLLTSLAAACAACLATQASANPFRACNAQPTSSLVLNVKDKGAIGNGRADDTKAIQKAIDEVAGTGGTVYVPKGVYMVQVAGKQRLFLGSKMTLKMADDAVLKVIPNDEEKYSVLRLKDVSDVAVIGGTLLGDRGAHKSAEGGRGMGIHVGPNARRITINGVTAKGMWGDGFYVDGAKSVSICSVVADLNRRQGLSIIDVQVLLVTDSVFQNTLGVRPGAGIDIEPDRPEQLVRAVRIEKSKFSNNAGGGVMIAGKRGPVADVEIVGNVFEEARPILIENAPGVLSTSVCDNRHIGQQERPAEAGFNAYAEAVEVVSLQDDCREGRDLRFEVNRITKKKKKVPAPQPAN